MKRFTLCVLVLGLASESNAQVGHLPGKSPYRDLEHRSELVFMGGHFNAAVDPARVAPGDGPMIAAHWEMRLGGPIYLTARMAGTFGERNVIDPSVRIGERFLKTRVSPTILTDVGFAMNLTGNKSWRGMIPTIGGGVGLGAGLEGRDAGGYTFGAPFLFTFRPGVKLRLSERWQGRIDATNYFYRVRYPDSYYTKTTEDPTVLPSDAERAFWKRNLAITAGITRTFGR